jgi:threonine synthase
MTNLRCSQCSAIFKPFPPEARCKKCGGLLEYAYDFNCLKNTELTAVLSFWRYRSCLPEVKNVVTMGEGGTPLQLAKRLTDTVGLKVVYLKDETRNPTGSFRDRCTALMVSNALDHGYESVICASNGNLGASLAAYCARSGILCHILVPEMVDMGKLAQMLIYDAVIEEHGETVDCSIERAEALAKETGWYQATAELNPLAVEAQKTIAYETAEQLGAPDWFIAPMGSGGTLYSIWKGFKEAQNLGLVDNMPKMVGVQAEGCAPIVETYLKKKNEALEVSGSATHALGILVRKPLNVKWAVEAISASGGVAVSVADSEIIEGEQEIARLEGVFAEPASSATIAALKKLVSKGTIDKQDSVVCLITGSGLKATDVLQALTKKRKTAVVGLELSTKEKILRILSEKETYGYDMWKKLGKSMTRAAVYQHLNDLSERGLVATYEKEGRKYFRVTERGKRVLRAISELKVLL